MLALFLVLGATLCEEVSSVFTKEGITNRKESFYTAGFLNLFFVTAVFFVIILYDGNFVFSLKSLPVFGTRVILEFALLMLALRAVAHADRTTFSFIHSGTIPLLLAVDVSLGYAISPAQLLGIALFCAVIIGLAFRKEINKTGAFDVTLLTIGAVGTLSLFKYDITHYNSLEAEQFLANLLMLIGFFSYNRFVRRENPFRAFGTLKLFVQSLSAGLATVLVSFAYLYGAASVITAMKRVGEVLWSLLSGRFYFHEAHPLVKLLIVAALGTSVVLLMP